MTKRRMNALILLGLLAVYSVCLTIIFNTCYAYRQDVYYDALLDIDYDIYQFAENVESGMYDGEDIQTVIDDYVNNLYVDYPFAIAVYDEECNMISQGGSYNGSSKYIIKEYQMAVSLVKDIKTIKPVIDANKGNDFSYGSNYFDIQSAFTIDGMEYFIVYSAVNNMTYDTLNSIQFRDQLYITHWLLIIAFVIFIVSNKLFDKNKKLNDAKQAFTSAAAHELKTPLTIINNQCECLMKEVAPEKNDEYIETIYRQNNHMTKLVSTLLQYNRLSGLDKIEKTECNLSDIVNSELEKYDALIENKNISAEKIIPESAFIKADYQLITLVVDNFLSNAVKNTVDGGLIRVRITDDGMEYILSVYNEGKGIKEEYRDKIWDIFNRSYDDCSDDNSTGMGLAVCKKILDLHKFKYGFENKKNGVEFFFRAPSRRKIK